MKKKQLFKRIMSSFLAFILILSTLLTCACGVEVEDPKIDDDDPSDNLIQPDTDDNTEKTPGWIVDTGAPDDSEGSDGVMYLNQSNYDIYYKSSGTWTKLGNIKGETGYSPTVTIKDGFWFVDGVNTLVRAIGRDGENGEDALAPTVEINADGYWVINGFVTSTKARGENGADGADGEDGEDGKNGINGFTPTVEINADGYWVINGVVSSVKAVGEDGVDGVDGIDGQDGQDGEDGEDGRTPTIVINDEGYWVVNNIVTGVKARGEDGQDGEDGDDGVPPTIEINDNGYWVINGVVSDVKARGEDGRDAIGSTGDGETVYAPTVEISDDGYWVINGEKTENKAVPTVEINDEGYWVINGVTTDAKAIGEDGAPGATGATGPAGVTPTIEINDEGYWVINGIVSPVKAQGEKGDKGDDGVTPTIAINDDGYWVINGEVSPVKARGEDGQDGSSGESSSVYIDEDGFWVINGEKTNYYAGEYIDPNPVEEKMGVEEFRNQVVSWGSCNRPADQTRGRIIFSVKMKAGMTVKFTGDTNVYKWAVVEVYDYCVTEITDSPARTENSLYDSNWLEAPVTTYTTQKDCWPMLTVCRIDGGGIDNLDLPKISYMFEIDGVKLSPTTADDPGMITEEEIKSQVVQLGVLGNQTATTRTKMIFSIKLEKGARIHFNNAGSHKWSVRELAHSSQNTNSVMDSGWNLTWPDGGVQKTADYITKIDGSTLMLIVAWGDDRTMTYEDITGMYKMFTITGTKWTGTKAQEQTEYMMNSISHRGYCLEAPENTLSAFRAAARHGYTTVECDVNFTSDGVPVLLHDDTVDRTSNGTGNIGSLTSTYVRSLDFGSWKDPAYTGEKIPTFQEFLELCKALNLHAYIDIKTAVAYNGTSYFNNNINYLVAETARRGMLDNVTWISNREQTLKYVLDADPTARVGYMPGDNSSISSWVTAINNLKNYSSEAEVFIDINHTYLLNSDGSVNTSPIVTYAATGCNIEMFTINNTVTFHKLAPFVSAVTTDSLIGGDLLKNKYLYGTH